MPNSSGARAMSLMLDGVEAGFDARTTDAKHQLGHALCVAGGLRATTSAPRDRPTESALSWRARTTSPKRIVSPALRVSE